MCKEDVVIHDKSTIYVSCMTTSPFDMCVKVHNIAPVHYMSCRLLLPVYVCRRIPKLLFFLPIMMYKIYIKRPMRRIPINIGRDDLSFPKNK